MMTLLGINTAANAVASLTQSSADPFVTLSPSQFEHAISQIAARFVWVGAFAISIRDGHGSSADFVYVSHMDLARAPLQTWQSYGDSMQV